MSSQVPSGAQPTGPRREGEPPRVSPAVQSAPASEPKSDGFDAIKSVPGQARTVLPGADLPPAAADRTLPPRRTISAASEPTPPGEPSDTPPADTPPSQSEAPEPAPSPSTDLVVRREPVEGEVVERFPGFKHFQPKEEPDVPDFSGKFLTTEVTPLVKDFMPPLDPPTIDGEAEKVTDTHPDDPPQLPPSRRAIPAADDPTGKRRPARARVPRPETPPPADASEPPTREPVENLPADQRNVQIYSRPRDAVQPTDRRKEEPVLDAVVDLRTKWDQEIGLSDPPFPETIRASFDEDLGDKNAAVAVVRDNRTGDAIGFGTLVEEAGQGELDSAYVLPNYRGNQIFPQIVDALLNVAEQRGYESVTAYPASDNVARGVLEEKGFVERADEAEGEGNVTLIKYLRPQENGPTQPRSEPTSLSAAYQPEKRTFPLPTPPSRIEFREIPEELEPYVEHTTPIVVPAGKDISVIGTNHWSIPPEPTSLPRDFTNALATARHVILEGSPFVYEKTYEAIAVTTAAEGKKSIRFLETEAGDPVHVLETAGMPPRVAAFVKMYHNLLLGVSEIYDNKSRSYQDSLTDTIEWLIPASRAISPYFLERTDEQLTNLFSGWIRGIERHLFQEGDTEGIEIAEGYEAKIRESKMFSAENMAALQRLPGGKTIIVGRSHAAVVIQALNGNYPQEPSRWRTYIRGLSQEEQDAVGVLYDLAYSSRRT